MLKSTSFKLGLAALLMSAAMLTAQASAPASSSETPTASAGDCKTQDGKKLTKAERKKCRKAAKKAAKASAAANAAGNAGATTAK